MPRIRFLASSALLVVARILFRWPTNKIAMIAHIGIVLVHSLIVASLLASLQHLGQFYALKWPVFFREMVGRPGYVIYSLIMLSTMCSSGSWPSIGNGPIGKSYLRGNLHPTK